MIDPRLIIALAAVIFVQFIGALFYLGKMDQRVGSVEESHADFETFLLTTGPALADIKARLVMIEQSNRDLVALIEQRQRERAGALREHLLDYHNSNGNNGRSLPPR